MFLSKTFRISKVHIFQSVKDVKGPLHLAKFAIANIVQVLAQMIRKVERSKIHIAQVKKF